MLVKGPRDALWNNGFEIFAIQLVFTLCNTMEHHQITPKLQTAFSNENYLNTNITDCVVKGTGIIIGSDKAPRKKTSVKIDKKSTIFLNTWPNVVCKMSAILCFAIIVLHISIVPILHKICLWSTCFKVKMPIHFLLRLLFVSKGPIIIFQY